MKLPVEEAKLACAPGSVLLFNWFGFSNLPSRPKSYQGFRETGPWRKRKKACGARWEGERQKKGAFSHRPTPAPSIFRLYGTCLHISHNAPYLPPKILHNLCVSFLLGITAVLREIENNAYAKKGLGDI